MAKRNTRETRSLYWNKAARKWYVRIYIRALGYQVYFGSYADFDEAKRVRNIQEMRLRIHRKCHL